MSGWLYTLSKHIEYREEEIHLKCIKLHVTERRNKQHNKYVTNRRYKQAIIHEIRESVMEFLSKRIIQDIDIIDILKPFIKLSQQSNIEQIHKILCNDLNLELFN